MRETMGKHQKVEEREKDDFYATPPKEVKNILNKEKLYGTILENSCGAGHIAEVVKEQYPFNDVIATDLIDRGYGEGGLDFLSDDYPYADNIDTIIMNPPFKLIEDFVIKSLKIVQKKVVLLARLQFVESITRYESIFSKAPPTRIWFYVDRINPVKNGNFEQYKSPSMTFAWYVWDKIDNQKGFSWIRKYEKEGDNE